MAPDLPIPAPSRWASTSPAAAAPAPHRPQPVQVRLCYAPAGALCAAAIQVSRDERLDTALYAIEVIGHPPLIVTHAQLAALVLGANALFAACHHAGVPQ